MDTGKVRLYLSQAGYNTKQINTLMTNLSVERALKKVSEQALIDGQRKSLERLVELACLLQENVSQTTHAADRPENGPKETTLKRIEKNNCVTWYTDELMHLLCEKQ